MIIRYRKLQYLGAPYIARETLILITRTTPNFWKPAREVLDFGRIFTVSGFMLHFERSEEIMRPAKTRADAKNPV